MLVRQLGRVDYDQTLAAMRAFTDARTADTPDELWVVEHAPVYTLGLAGKREHLLCETDIPVVQTDRGGQVTYHGPGQVVVYLLVDLRRGNIKVRELVSAIEAAVIDVLAAYNQQAVRKPGAPGVYVGSADAGTLDKIAALGLKIRRNCSYHGVSLNVSMDLTPFTWINPCGYAGLRTVDLASLGIHTSFDEVAARLTARLTARIEELREELHEHPDRTAALRPDHQAEIAGQDGAHSDQDHPGRKAQEA